MQVSTVGLDPFFARRIKCKRKDVPLFFPLISRGFEMKKKRDTVTYELKQGNEVVYVGTTNDPERREHEHKEEGKKFSHMKVTSRKITDDGAKQKESTRLKTYRKNQGKNPQYNKDSDG